MGIRALCAAAAVAAGVGQAEAATAPLIPTIDDDVYVSFLGTVTENQWLCGLWECYDPIPPRSDLILNAEVGQTDTVKGIIFFKSPGSYGLNLIGFGRYLYVGEVDLLPDNSYAGTYFENDTDPFIMTSISVLGFGYVSLATDDLEHYQTYSISLSPLQPAPIPLPSSAALLPIGAAALAFVRRRRTR